jgi:hypothetical protein
MKKAPRTKGRGFRPLKTGQTRDGGGFRMAVGSAPYRSFSPCVHTDGEQNQIVVNVTYCSRLYDYFFLIKKNLGAGGFGGGYTIYRPYS